MAETSKFSNACQKAFPPDLTVTYTDKLLLLGGYFGEILNIFNRKFNISFKLNQTKGDQYGAIINGNWTGMIGDLTHGRADITTGISMTSSRADFINFSPQLFDDKYEIIYRTLDQYEWNYKFYLQPYNTQMWLCVFAISLTVILFKVLANIVSKQKHFSSNCLNFIDELLLCWPIVLQGNLFSFSLTSMKLVYGFFIAFSMLLLVSYNSTLTSLLSVTELKIPFSSLEDMIENTNFLPAILGGSNLEEIFQTPLYQNKSLRRVSTLIEGIELIYNKKFGFISSLKIVQHLIGSNCSFSVAPRSISREIISIGYSKQFNYMEFFNYKLLSLKQYGILSGGFKRFYPEQHSCSENLIHPVSFDQIVGLFILMMSAILISLIIGIFELIIGKIK
uniref:Ionotropic glutamate receptor L-glutamate and glycine-binding domain-containing protein n=1 Tax=Strigamia maritima TaxID=126957 RepID=T1JMH8_STRMM